MVVREKDGRRLSRKEINQDPDLPTLEIVLKFFKTTKISSIWDGLEKKLEKTATDGKTYILEEVKELLYKKYLEKGPPLAIVEIMEKTKEEKLPGKKQYTDILKHKKLKIFGILFWRKKRMNKIKEIFYKYWKKEKSDKFCESLESSVISYKVEYLEKFIEDIFEENPNVKRDERLRCAKNMVTFTDTE